MGHVLRLAALALLACGAALAWSGCHDLSGDCDLNLTCAEPDACAGVLPAGTCAECLLAACCAEAAACKGDDDCLACFHGHVTDSPACGDSVTRSTHAALQTCLDTHCAKACATLDVCNPVTNAGCLGGTACDLSDTEPPYFFTCYPPPFNAQLCEPCNDDSASGPYCDVALTCDFKTKTCAHFCCSDADCGTGRCEIDPQKAFAGALANAGDLIGICLAADGAPACDAPAVSASKGLCLQGLGP